MTESERRRWLEERQSGIGSSDVPEILGEGWGGADGPRRVYLSKVEPVDPRLPRSGPLLRGIELEPLVAQKYTEQMGVELLTVPLSRHPNRQWQMASNDRIRPDNGRHTEFKTVSSFSGEWGEQGSDQIPVPVRLQTTWQCGVIGSDEVDVFVLSILDWATRLFRVPFDRELFHHLTRVGEEFWHDHVVLRKAPDERWAERASELTSGIKRTDKPVELPADWIAILEQRREYAVERDANADKVKAIDAQLKAVLGPNRAAVCGPFRITKTYFRGGSVNYERQPYETLTVRASR